MIRPSIATITLSILLTGAAASWVPQLRGQVQQIDLAAQLSAGKLRPFNRRVEPLQGSHEGVHVTEGVGPGVVWIAGSDFVDGEIDLQVRGRDVQQRSFVGIAFHGADDTTYEAVYLRPFNFQNPDRARRQNAVQYMALPAYDWPRLRREFPSEFENPVDASIEPTGWVHLRVVVTGRMVQVYVGDAPAAALEARALGEHDRGEIGLWVGNNSDGDFADLRLLPRER